MRGLTPYRVFLLQPLAMAATFTHCTLRPAISTATKQLRTTNYLLSHSFDACRTPSFFGSPANVFSTASSPASPICTETVHNSKTQSIRSAVTSPHSAKKKKKSLSSTKSSSSAICPGCGITMQDSNPDMPGYFIKPRRLSEEEEDLEAEFKSLEGAAEAVVDEQLEEDDYSKIEDEISGDEEHEDEIENATKEGGWTWVTIDPNDKTLSDLDGKFNVQDIERELSKDTEWEKKLDGFRSVSPEFRGSSSKVSKSNKAKSGGKMDESDKLMVCARCHKLRHYGRVADPTKEALLPDFDFEHTVGARLSRTHATRMVVVMVVDSVDFDGSFPRRAATLLADLVERESKAWTENKSGNVPRLILVANKIDLLPKQISPTRLEHWVRRRAKDGGAPHISGLFLVSCVKNWGVKAVLESIKEMAGPRGEVWVVGAQNAGKSSLINALSKVEPGAPLTQLTEAPIPGTTLGLVRLGGILPAKAKLFDTPGLLHPHQITVRLNREEQKIVQARKELKPRTYRVKAGDTIHVGGLVRMDVRDISASSMYITVWASTLMPCHFTKTAKAKDVFEKHVGVKLQPPLSKERFEELGPWVETPITITGDTWEKNSTDIAVAGLGWFSIGLKGTADLDIWTFEGVGITTRSALVPDMARFFEKAGFTVLKGGASN